MDKKITRYLDERNLQMSKIVERGERKGIKRDQIIAAIPIVFDRMASGEIIKDINLVWEIWRVAKTLPTSERANDLSEEAREKLVKLKVSNRELKKELRKQINLYHMSNANFTKVLKHKTAQLKTAEATLNKYRSRAMWCLILQFIFTVIAVIEILGVGDAIRTGVTF